MTKTSAIKQARDESSMYWQGSNWTTSVWSEEHQASLLDHGSPYPQAVRSLLCWRVTRVIALLYPDLDLDEWEVLACAEDSTGDLASRVRQVEQYLLQRRLTRDVQATWVHGLTYREIEDCTLPAGTTICKIREERDCVFQRRWRFLVRVGDAWYLHTSYEDVVAGSEGRDLRH
jgi:hypothetical protein